MTAKAASIPTIRCVDVKLLVALKPLKQLCQNITYSVFICKQIINMKSILLSIDQSNILNLNEVAVKATYERKSTQEKIKA